LRLILYNSSLSAATDFSVGAAAGAATGSAAITVVQNTKTNATINNPKRFIFKSPSKFCFI